MALTFKEYVEALSAAAKNAAEDVNLTKNAKPVLAAYNKYVADLNTAGKGDVLPFEEWAKKPENINAIEGFSTLSSAEKNESVDAAKKYLEGSEKIRAAKTDLFANGKYALEQAQGFLGKIWDFVKSNGGTLGGAAIAAFAANAMGMGGLGLALLAVGGAVAGAVLVDKENGFIGSKVFGMQPPPPVGVTDGKIVVAPGNDLAVTSLKGTGAFKAMEEGKSLEMAAVSDYKPTDAEKALTEAGVTKRMKITRDGRDIFYYGQMQGDDFVATHSIISDEGKPNQTSPIIDIRRYTDAEKKDTNTAKPGLVFKTKKGPGGIDLVDFSEHKKGDHKYATSEAVINNANENLKKIKDPNHTVSPSVGLDPTIGKIPEKLAVRVTKEPVFEKDKDVAAVTLVITNPDAKEGDLYYQRTVEGTYNKNGELTISRFRTREGGKVNDPTEMCEEHVITEVKMNGDKLDVSGIKQSEIKKLLKAMDDNYAPREGNYYVFNDKTPARDPNSFDLNMDNVRKLSGDGTSVPLKPKSTDPEVKSLA